MTCFDQQHVTPMETEQQVSDEAPEQVALLAAGDEVGANPFTQQILNNILNRN